MFDAPNLFFSGERSLEDNRYLFKIVKLTSKKNDQGSVPYPGWGTWKPGYAGGGSQFDPPPSKPHVWCPNMTNDTSLESSCALLLESAKKFRNLQKLNFFLQNPVI